MKVLIAEDDPLMVETVSMALSLRWPDGEVKNETTGAGAIGLAAREPFDLVILDVNLPDQEGFDVLQAIRKNSQVPVIMLTVRASERDKVRGLELGADDYVAKPFSPFELVARASAVLRRAGPAALEAAESALEYGSVKLNFDTAEVFVDGRPVRLSPTEFRMLELLVRHAGKVVKPDLMLKEVWGLERTDADAHLIKLHMQNLRRKIGDNGTQPRIILTVRGFGYKLAGG
jgi:DNA-binding response OmpR family regulator